MGKPGNSDAKKRARWTTEQLQTAMKSVQRGFLSQHAASKRYQVPRRTLRNHLKSGSTERKLGRSSIFTSEQEEDLVKRIFRLAEVGMPLTPKILRLQAYKFCEKHNIRHYFNNEKSLAGKKWLMLFLQRHPEISCRKSQMMNPARAQKLNKYIVCDHFTKVKALLEKLSIENRPECIYNMDEKGCRISLHHQQSVLAMKGSKRVHQIANEHAENVTIVGCVNAIGTAIPPMILFKGKKLKVEFSDNLPAGSLVKMTPKGYMTHDTFVHFIAHLGKYKTSGPCLLIFDGAACHLDYSIVEVADEHNIALYCLPSNTTHELQPLDKAVYRSFEHHWDQEFLKYVGQNPERKINKTSFNMIFSKVWSKCMSHDNIASGFRATGLYPFNPDIIPETAFAPSALSELSNPTSNKNTVPSTSGSVSQLGEHRRTYAREDTSSSGSETENLPLSALKSNALSGQKTPGTRTSESVDVAQVDTQVSIIKSPFHQFISTPKSKVNKNAPRKKAFNYRGQEVTRDLFTAKPKTPSISVGTTDASSTRSVGTAANTVTGAGVWYCQACQEDRMEDMRQCQTCGVWYHELCVGLTEEDKNFDCPGCSP